MNRQLRPLVLIILSVLLLSKLSLAPVKAEIICQNTTPIAAYNDSQVKLQGNTLLWLNETHALKRYDLVSEITSEIATEAGNFDVDGDHIVFTDPADQIQLYTISTGSTTPITGGSKQYSDPRIEGNNVVYRKRKLATDGKVYYRLYVYDIVLATKTAVGHKYPKSYDYDLDQGRILWGGNNLYTIATGSNTSLGSYNFVDLDGDHAVTVIRADYASNVILKELSSGKVSQLTHYSSGEVGEVIDINSVELGGDYVTWAVDITDSEGSYGGVLLYQISTGKQIDPGMPENRFPFAGIHEPFVSGKLLDDTANYWHLYLYDIPSTSLTPMVYGDYVASVAYMSDNRNIAWVGAKYDSVADKTYEPTLFLRTDCGSTPKIIAQSPDLNILTGRSVELFVTIGAGQPITCQWYQGEPGDTSLPVGSNSPTFTTPPLTDTTTYWIRASNPYGTEDSDPITITPGTTAELVLNGGFEASIYEDDSVWQSKQMLDTVYTISDQPHSGEWSLLVSAYDAFPKAKVKQQLPAVPYQTGDQLTLSGWMVGKDITAASAIVQLKVEYADGSKAKAVIKPVLAIFDYTLFTAEPLTISGNVSDVRIQIKYTGSKYGPWILDDLSVLQSLPANTSPLTLPAQSDLQSRK